MRMAIFTLYFLYTLRLDFSRWDEVEDILEYGLVMLGLLILPTSLVTGRFIG